MLELYSNKKCRLAKYFTNQKYLLVFSKEQEIFLICNFKDYKQELVYSYYIRTPYNNRLHPRTLINSENKEFSKRIFNKKLNEYLST
jgi:hypothetical protein